MTSAALGIPSSVEIIELLPQEIDAPQAKEHRHLEIGASNYGYGSEKCLIQGLTSDY